MHRKFSNKSSLILAWILHSMLCSCFPYDQIRTHYSAGSDDGANVARVILPHSVAVIKMNGLTVPNGINLETFTAKNNRVMNLLPGKHLIEYTILSNSFTTWNYKAAELEVKANEVYALCFNINNETKEWNPWIMKLEKKAVGEENFGFYHLYFKNFTDRFRCFSHADF